MTVSDTKRWWVMVGVGVASFIGCIDFTIVNTALPAIQRAFNLSFTQLQWVMNVFMFMLPIFLVFGGRLGDVYGHRKVFYSSVILFGVASLGAGIASHMVPLLICRGLQGIAASVIFPCGAAIVLHSFPEQEQGKAMSILYSIYGIGLAIGPVVGGVLLEVSNWRWIFLVNVPIILISFVICLPSVEKTEINHQEHLDYRGVLLMMIGLGALTVAIAEGNNLGWSSPITISLFVIGFLVSSWWWHHELKSDQPTMNFRLFKHRNVVASLVSSMVLGAFYALGFFLMPLYLDNVRHMSAFMTGLMLVATSLLVAVISPFMGYFMDRYPVKYLICIGLGFFVISAVMQSCFGLTTSIVFVVFAFIAFGIAWGMIGAPLITALMRALPSNASGVATGSLWTVQNVGAVIGLAIGTAIFQLVAHVKITQHLNLVAFVNGYRAAMIFLLAFSAAIFLFTSVVMQRRRD